jgi:hypothetical protein
MMILYLYYDAEPSTKPPALVSLKVKIKYDAVYQYRILSSAGMKCSCCYELITSLTLKIYTFLKDFY